MYIYILIDFFFQFDSFKVIFFWLRWILVTEHRLSLVAQSRPHASSTVPASHCGDSSCWRAQALEHGFQKLWTRV